MLPHPSFFFKLHLYSATQAKIHAVVCPGPSVRRHANYRSVSFGTMPPPSGLSVQPRRQCHFLSTYRRWWWRAHVTLSSRGRTLRHGPWGVLATKYSLDEGNKHVKWRALYGVAMTSLNTQQILVEPASIDYVRHPPRCVPCNAHLPTPIRLSWTA